MFGIYEYSEYDREDWDFIGYCEKKEDAIKILNSGERCDIKFFMALQSFVQMGEEIFK